MAQVFVSYADKDREAALPIIGAISQAGLEVLHPSTLTPGDDSFLRKANCVVVLWSQAAAKSLVVQQAVIAWSIDKLVLATLDDTPLPVGLRDLSPSPISIRGASDSGTKQLIGRVRAMVDPAFSASRRRAVSPVAWIIGAALFAFAGLVLALPYMSVFHRVYEAPVTPNAPPTAPEVVMSLSTLAALALLILGAAIGAGAVFLWNVRSKRSQNRGQLVSKRPEVLVDPRAVDLGSSSVSRVFVSYSHQDARTVEELVKQIEGLGYTVWIDRQLTGPQRYAGPIVTAIRHSRLVALMCSQNAFASDHVIREVYLAGDYKKPFIVFQLDSTEFPDELRYFVSGFPRVPVATVDLQQLRSQIAKLIAA